MVTRTRRSLNSRTAQTKKKICPATIHVSRINKRKIATMKLFYCGFNGFQQVEERENQGSSTHANPTKKLDVCHPIPIFESADNTSTLEIFLGWSRIIITTSEKADTCFLYEVLIYFFLSQDMILLSGDTGMEYLILMAASLKGVP